MNMKHYICLIILLTIFPLMNSCVPVEKHLYVKGGKEYGVTKGLFRGRWWNHYERGISFGEGDFLNEAETDFRTAVKQRSDDQRTARTYGMHFIDYFPHRELGIILYKKGLFQEAIKELELSLSSEESAKAKFYLNKSRKTHLRTEIRDTTPPRIYIATPERNSIANSFYVMVSGEATDINYVASLTINGIPEFIELSDKKIEFKRKVELLPGPNQITITAQDLLGNTHKESFNVQADYQGPNLSVINFMNNQQVNKQEIIVNMSYSDESGIEYVTLEGKKEYPQGNQSGTISTKIKLKNGKNLIQMEALDNAGNKTTGEISIIYYPGKLVAFNNSYDISGFASQIATDAVYIAKKTDDAVAASDIDKQPPEISFRGLLKVLSDNEPLTITGRKNNNRFFIEGQASDNSNIEEILINDTPVSFNQGKVIIFNRLLEFKEGENQFKIVARDFKGNTATKSVKVIRRIPQIDLEESKMTLSIMPFKNSSMSSDLADSIYNLFMQEIINSERFNVIERGPAFENILKELNLSQTDLVDKEKAVQTGRLLASEVIMIGNIIENKNEVEIYAKLINVETSEYIAAHDVYGQDKSRTRIEYLLAGLASEIVYSVPLVEGQILAVKGNEFFIDIGKTKHFNIKKGTKCLVYKSTPFIVDGVNLGEDTSIIGTLVINRVNPKFSSSVLHEFDSKKGRMIDIKKSDKVITK